MRTNSKHSGRIEQRGSLLAIAAHWHAWKSTFAAACKHDGISEHATFAVFSQDNPFVVFVNKGHEEYVRCLSEYQAGGYVGLSLSAGDNRSTTRASRFGLQPGEEL